MSKLRRYATYLIAAFALILLYRQIQSRSVPPAQTVGGYALPKVDSVAEPDFLTDTTDTSPSQASWAWSSIPTKYPVSSMLALPSGPPVKLPKVQYAFSPETSAESTKRKERQKKVRDAFERCWKSYRDRAWMHDELAPLTGDHSDKFGGWGATLVDNLDTLWIMGFEKEFNDAVEAALTIDTTSTKLDSVNIFETTIRNLGGLLSAYDLSSDERLLTKAKELGEMLYKAFDTPNHLPVTRWPFRAAIHGEPQQAPEQVLLAEIGSLSMEFTRLSQLTGDPKWFDAVHKITLLFARDIKNTALPGMFPVSIGAAVFDVTTDNWFTLNGMSDSFYEYLPKMHLLLGGREPVYEKLYLETAATAIKHTLFRPMTPDYADILFSGSVRVKSAGPELVPQAQHLGCFTGGMFALGGKLFDQQKHLSIGRKLTDGCVWAYQSMPLGIMPELFLAVQCKDTSSCQWDEEAWREAVWSHTGKDETVDTWVKKARLIKGVADFEDRKYHLRPEAIESVFLLYRMTGDATLLDVAEEMFTAIMDVTTTKLANAAMLDVTYTHEELKFVASSNQQFDSMESFWMAETLKYFYLIFSEPEVLSLDEWVFNTEAHPFKRPSSRR